MSVTAIKDSFKQQGQKKHPSEVQEVAKLLDSHLGKSLTLEEVAHPQRPREIKLPIKKSLFFQK
jgi:hypothetical protein